MQILSRTQTSIISSCYQIAGLWCKIDFPRKVSFENLLTSSEPFRRDVNKIDGFVCKIVVSEDCFKEDISSFHLLSEVKGVLGECLLLYENEFAYITIISYEEGKYKYAMISNKDFSDSTVYLKLDDSSAGEALTSFFMVAFSQMAVAHQTVLIHASVVEKENLGFAFLGKSGTGKSTHSSLWLRYIGGTKLLNDDNPAVQVDSEGNIFIYGTPWSGKTPCYTNRKVELAAIVRLNQAPENRISEARGLDAMIALLPSCSSLRWNDHLYSSLCDVLEMIIDKIPVCVLKCLPNQDAAEICFGEIKKLRLKQTLIK
ncbi:MAG: hypothetical protein H6Q14_1142 [Bacteroidetes bacterium]|jgi:hypothetical protein|nr:hypothetical protein [Bacteroidota bacterium]